MGVTGNRQRWRCSTTNSSPLETTHHLLTVPMDFYEKYNTSSSIKTSRETALKPLFRFLKKRPPVRSTLHPHCRHCNAARLLHVNHRGNAASDNTTTDYRNFSFNFLLSTTTTTTIQSKCLVGYYLR